MTRINLLILPLYIYFLILDSFTKQKVDKISYLQIKQTELFLKKNARQYEIPSAVKRLKMYN